MSTVPNAGHDVLGSALPGDQLVRSLRPRVRHFALTHAPTTSDHLYDPAARIADVLYQWSAFGRHWLPRLLPPAPAATDPGEADSLEKAGPPDLDPWTADGVHRLQKVWAEVIGDLLERGRRLKGVDFFPFGVEELMGDVYLVAARRWPAFVYSDHENTVRWLLRILRYLIRKAIERDHRYDAIPLACDPAWAPTSDTTGSQATRSRAEEREVMAARVFVLHGALPAECQAPDLPDRLVARPTLQLLVAADTLETAFRLTPEDQRVWGLLTVRQESAKETARMLGVKVNALNVRFHRLRSLAIGLLAECWAAVEPRS